MIRDLRRPVLVVVVVGVLGIRLGAGRVVTVTGAPVVDAARVAEYTLPYQHISLTPQGATVLVTLEDGTGYPTRTFVTAPSDGQPMVTVPTDNSCRDDRLCAPLVVAVQPGLAGTARTEWLGMRCEVSGGPVQRVAVSCRPGPPG